MHQLSVSSGAMVKGWRLLSIRVVASFLIVLMCNAGSSAYSVLTHEEIVDLLWADEIRPLLLKRYPRLSEDQITQAHAYAYGGAVIQIWATIRSATRNSAIWCITFAAATSFANC